MQRGNNFYNDEITPFSGRQLSAGMVLRKKLFSKITLTLNGDLSRSVNKQKSINSSISNETASEKFKGEWNQNISSAISYSLAYYFTTYRQGLQQPVQNQFFDFNIKVAPIKWKSFFEFQCINLVNQNLYRQINSSANQLSTYEMPLRERTFLLKYAFTF